MHVAANGTRLYSPLTLCQDWPIMPRLMLMVTCSLLGTIINGFFVAGFFVDNALTKIGNVFLALTGITDIIVTSGVMPVSVLLLLSGQWDTVPVCHAIQFLMGTSTYCYTWFFTLVSMETYFRICLSSTTYRKFISMRVDLVTTLILANSSLISGIGVYMELDYDYCQRLHHGNYHFKVLTALIFHYIPFIITVIGLSCSVMHVRDRARDQLMYKRSRQYERDNCITTLNIVAYCMYVIAWAPYLIIVHLLPDIADSTFYQCAWLGVSRSLLTSIMYSILDPTFRHAFAHIYYYCCCKTTLPRPHNNRQRRLQYRTTRSNVRVHIMQQAVNYYNTTPQRAVGSYETREL